MIVAVELFMLQVFPFESVTLALHQYMPLWLVWRGVKSRVKVAGDELITDTSIIVRFSMIVLSGPIHSITMLSIRFWSKLTEHLRLYLSPAIEVLDALILTLGWPGTIESSRNIKRLLVTY